MFKKSINPKHLILMILVSVFTLFVFKVACYSQSLAYENKEIIPKEYKLVSANIEMRSVTNNFGGILRTDKIFHYGFVTSAGQVVFKEKEMLNNYSGVNYCLDFYIGDENKIFEYYNFGKVNLVFLMKESMYRQVFNRK